MAKKRTIMRALKIAEISGVDVPAQEGAKALLMKRHTPAEPITKGSAADVHDERSKVAKSAALTDVVDGHTHLLYTSGTDGDWDAGTTSWHNEHSHPWVRTPDGSIVLGEVDGHTHQIVAMTKAVETETETTGEAGSQVGKKEADAMPNDPKTPNVEDLQKQLARATAVSTLNDAQKAHFAGLDDKAQDAFLAKSADDRDAEIAAVAKAKTEADHVVYKTADGIEIRKSAGDAVIAMAKSMDATNKENAELRKANADAALRKSAETEFANLPGDVETRMALIKSVNSIEDETQRELAKSALKAQNAAMAGAFVTKGHGGAPVAGSSEDELEKLAKAHAEANPGMSEAQAYDAVLKTAKGQELYNKALQ